MQNTVEGRLALTNLKLIQKSDFPTNATFQADISASGPLKSPLLKGSVAIDEGKVSMPPVSPEAAGTYKALINPKFAIDMKTNNPVSMTIGTGNFLLTGSGLLQGTFELPDLEALHGRPRQRAPGRQARAETDHLLPERGLSAALAQRGR